MLATRLRRYSLAAARPAQCGAGPVTMDRVIGQYSWATETAAQRRAQQRLRASGTRGSVLFRPSLGTARRTERRAQRRQRHELAAMSDYELHDLSLSRAQLPGLFEATATNTADAWHADADRRNERAAVRL